MRVYYEVFCHFYQIGTTQTLLHHLYVSTISNGKFTELTSEEFTSFFKFWSIRADFSSFYMLADPSLIMEGTYQPPSVTPIF